MQFEGIEVVAEILRHVVQPLGVEQREDLVILPPEFAQPLHGQRVGRHHQTARDLARVDEPIEDERCLDGLAQSHFVGEQPSHGIGRAGVLGDVELVRE